MKPERADHYLSWVDREIDRVEASAAGWDSGVLPVEERMSLRLEWDDVVDRYLTVVKAHDTGELPETITARLVNVSARLVGLVLGAHHERSGADADHDGRLVDGIARAGAE